MKCPNNCTEKEIERRFLQNHLDEECPQQEIDCKFSFAGCPAKMKRRLMLEHLKDSKDEHLDTLSAYARDMKSELTALQIAFTQGTGITQCIFVPPAEMVMKNVEKLKEVKSEWYSPAFHTHIGGYKMCLKISMKRWDDGISLFIFMMKGEFDSHLKWPFRGVVTVQLINQAEGGEHHECKPVEIRDATMNGYTNAFKRCTEHDRSWSGWGLVKLMSYADLYKPEEGKQYLKNDTLKFRVTKVVVTSV